MKCEYCHKEHTGDYATGRFCSAKCARGFSSREKREEINEKVSKRLGKYSKHIKKEDIVNIVSKATSMRDAARKLQIPYTTFKRIAEKFNLYKPNQGWAKGLKFHTIPDKELFKKGTSNNNEQRRNRYIELHGYYCNVCKRKTWNNKPIPLELHHKNGDRTNNELDNLDLECLNCHAQTDTFRRNRGRVVIKVADSILKDALLKTKNIHKALSLVGLAPFGANYKRAKKLLKEVYDQTN